MTTFKTSTQSARDVAADLLIVPVFTGQDVGPGLKELRLADAYAAARLTGKKDENLLITPGKGDRFAASAVLLVGVGAKDRFDLTAMRRALAKAVAGARRFPTVATTFALALPAKQAADASQAAVEAIGLGAYRFDRYKKPSGEPALKRATVLVGARWNAKAVAEATKAGAIIVDAVCWARDLVNTPAGDLPPAGIAKEAQSMAKTVGLTCKVWSEAQLKQGGFGGILGVGQGSANPPRMIELRYTGAGKATPIALTGKGIAFDSGGLSLKDPAGMETMKCDMGGAASILATMRVIARLKPKINVIAAIPCSENMPSGTAQRPGDVITHRGGTTSEVLNTDAEGRLILADSLAYLAEQHPSCIIDTATLTGACVVALGTDIAGAFGNDDILAQELVAAGSAVGEPIWQMPLWADYRPLIDSKVADIKNIGKRYGGAITAAWFLATFVGDTPWVHLDIAGPAFTEGPTDLGPAGATGVPVRALVRFLLDRAGASRS
ncbi:MAG: leucyl aminopeptidase [Actinomycetota bacterium]